jgi:hypothetical protein
MTTYSYKLVLDDGEAIMMNAALEMMIKHCEDRLIDKSEAPFHVWLASAKAVKSRMHLNTEMMSTNNFWNNKDQ